MCPSGQKLIYNFIVNEESFFYWVPKWVGAVLDTQEPKVLFLSYSSVMCNLPLKGEKPLLMKTFFRPRLLVFLLDSVPSIAPL